MPEEPDPDLTDPLALGVGRGRTAADGTKVNWQRANSGC
jgi:hypothetical protein